MRYCREEKQRPEFRFRARLSEGARDVRLERVAVG